MSTHYGWADLDEQNRKHYGRGKPERLLKAEQELYRLDAEYDDACDTYYDLHYGEPEYWQACLDAKQAVEDAEQEYHEAYYQAYGKSNKNSSGKNEDF